MFIGGKMGLTSQSGKTFATVKPRHRPDHLSGGPRATKGRTSTLAVKGRPQGVRSPAPLGRKMSALGGAARLLFKLADAHREETSRKLAASGSRFDNGKAVQGTP